MPNGKGAFHRVRHRSDGNGALLVIVNDAGGYWDRRIVEETTLVALEHYGMPYRLLDLAAERPSAPLLSHCAGIIVAQNHVAETLTTAEAALISEAVSNGLGYVSFDNDLQRCPAPLLEMFGFARINPHPFATDLMRVPGPIRTRRP